MIFDKNQTEFKDCIQEKVWELGTRLLPLDITLPYVPDEYKSACEDLYNFTHDILVDMYENPQNFGFVIDSTKSDYENKKQVEFYFWLMGWAKILAGNELIFTLDGFNKFTKKYNPTCMERLKSHGFVFENTGTVVKIRNDK